MKASNERRDIDIALRRRRQDEHVLEVLDPTGHITLRWSPDDPASVERAREEFDKLKAAGFAFFVDEASAIPIVRLKQAALAMAGQLDVRPAAVREFEPRRRRTVAVRPMQGG